jgi:ParB/RepB/Spo0J family partition protein
MTTFAHYPIEKVLPHPKNVRHEAVASAEMVESIRSAGILEPVILGPENADGIRYLIAGNVRHNGALQAELTTLPAVLRDDLVTEAQQIEAMLVENLHRTDLTAVEEAEGYEQLQLFGMDEAAIAAATGRSKATVKSRLRLNDLPAKARERLHSGEATLVDAEALLEFADDHEVQSQLEASLGTSDFKWRVQHARDARDRAERNAKVIEGFKDLGAAEADPSGDDWQRLTSFWTKDLQDAAGHTHSECLGYVDHGTASYGAPFLVCLDPESHAEQEAETRGSVGAGESSSNIYRPDPEWEARREQQEKERAERAAASKVRLDHLTTVLRGVLPTKGKAAAALADATRALLPSLLANSMLDDLLHANTLDHALGLDTTATGWNERHAQRVDHAVELATTTNDADLLDALAQLLAVLAEEALTATGDGSPSDPDREADERAMAATAWEWMESTGHDLSPVDDQVRLLAVKGNPDDEDGDD